MSVTRTLCPDCGFALAWCQCPPKCRCGMPLSGADMLMGGLCALCDSVAPPPERSPETGERA